MTKFCSFILLLNMCSKVQMTSTDKFLRSEILPTVQHNWISPMTPARESLILPLLRLEDGCPNLVNLPVNRGIDTPSAEYHIAKYGTASLIKKLTSMGVVFYGAPFNGHTYLPIDAVIGSNDNQKLKFFLTAEAVTQQNSSGESALDFAFNAQNTDLAITLIEAGIRPQTHIPQVMYEFVRSSLQDFTLAEIDLVEKFIMSDFELLKIVFDAKKELAVLAMERQNFFDGYLYEDNRTFVEHALATEHQPLVELAVQKSEFHPDCTALVRADYKYLANLFKRNKKLALISMHNGEILQGYKYADGRTFIMPAVENNNIELISETMKLDPTILHYDDPDALMKALKTKQTSLYLSMAKQVPAGHPIIQRQDSKENTHAHWMVYNEVPAKHFHELARQGSPLSEKNRDGHTPKDLALQLGLRDVVRVLETKNAKGKAAKREKIIIPTTDENDRSGPNSPDVVRRITSIEISTDALQGAGQYTAWDELEGSQDWKAFERLRGEIEEMGDIPRTYYTQNVTTAKNETPFIELRLSKRGRLFYRIENSVLIVLGIMENKTASKTNKVIKQAGKQKAGASGLR